MLDNAAFDVCIGLVFIFLLYSLLATIVQEMLAQLFNLRARNLVKTMRRVLQDSPKRNYTLTFLNFFSDFFDGVGNYFSPLPKDSFLKAFYEYPLIKYMGQNGHNSKPSYIAAADFSETMIHLLRGEMTNNQGNQLMLVQTNLNKNQFVGFTIDLETLSYLKKLVIDSVGDIEKFRAKLEFWYNSMMERSTGWYKRQTQSILFFTGLFVAISFNIDSIAISKILIHNKEIRGQMATLAVSKVTVYGPAPGPSSMDDKALQASLAKMKSDASDVQNILGLGHSPTKVDTSCMTRIKSRFKDLAAEKQLDTAKLRKLANDAGGCQLPDTSGNIYQGGFLFSLLGWIITALAVSLGAPFWFDLLSKIVSLRSAGSPPKDDKTTSSATGDVKIKPVG